MNTQQERQIIDAIKTSMKSDMERLKEIAMKELLQEQMGDKANTLPNGVVKLHGGKNRRYTPFQLGAAKYLLSIGMRQTHVSEILGMHPAYISAAISRKDANWNSISPISHEAFQQSPWYEKAKEYLEFYGIG